MRGWAVRGGAMRVTQHVSPYAGDEPFGFFDEYTQESWSPAYARDKPTMDLYTANFYCAARMSGEQSAKANGGHVGYHRGLAEGFERCAMRLIGAFLILVLAALPALATDIRVRNDTSVALTEVMVGSKRYGDIGPGETTDYQHWDLAYHSASFSLRAGSSPAVFQPSNYYLREGELDRGKWTYVLRYKGGVLRIYAEKDEQ